MWKIRFNILNFQLYHSLYILTAIPSWNSSDFSQKPLWAELGCYYLVPLISWRSLGSSFSYNSVIFSHIKNCKTHFAGDSDLIWTLMRSWNIGKYNMKTDGKSFFCKSLWQKASVFQTSFQISLLLTSLFVVGFLKNYVLHKNNLVYPKMCHKSCISTSVYQKCNYVKNDCDSCVLPLFWGDTVLV